VRRESENPYSHIMQSMDEGFCLLQLLFNADGKAVDYVFLEANASFEKQTGIQNAKGRRIREVAPTYEEHWFELYGHIARTGESKSFEYAAPQLGRWFEGHAYRAGTGNDTIAVIFHDITEPRRREQQLTESNKALEERVAAQALELAKCYEQLREMATDLTLAEQRERKKLATELHEDLAERLMLARLKLGQIHQRAILDAPSEQLLKEADVVLTRSLAYTRTLVADLSPMVLQDLGLSAAVRWLAERLEQHGLAVTVRTTLPDQLVLPEPHTAFLFQSVRELLTNTLKHAKCRGASVFMTMPPGHVQIEVSDEGVGFVSESTDPSGRPSRFGLFSIRERIKAFGGTFEIDSRPDQGTKAILKLALGPIAMEADTASSAGSRTFRGGIIRVLLVDDHAMVRQGLRSVLDAYADMKVVGEAADGEAAIRLTTELLPNVVLMDINMPVCNGVVATQRITTQHPDIRVIGLSVNAESDNQEAMLKAGAFSLMTKEAAVEQLYTLIYQAVKPGVVPFSPLR
jgi:signal transduction histidine kinase